MLKCFSVVCNSCLLSVIFRQMVCPACYCCGTQLNKNIIYINDKAVRSSWVKIWRTWYIWMKEVDRYFITMREYFINISNPPFPITVNSDISSNSSEFNLYLPYSVFNNWYLSGRRASTEFPCSQNRFGQWLETVQPSCSSNCLCNAEPLIQ